MARFKVQQNYRSERDGELLGPWSKGDEIDLDQPIADHVERDAPGTLADLKPQVAKKATPGKDAS